MFGQRFHVCRRRWLTCLRVGGHAVLYTLICVAFLGLMTATALSAEKPHATLGVLTCTLIKPAQDAGQKLTCGFKPAGSGAEEKYSGTIRESGQDLPSGKVVLIWTVLGPAEGKMRVGILAQRYVKGIGG